MSANMTTMNLFVKMEQTKKSNPESKNTASHCSISIVNSNQTYYKENKILIKDLDIEMHYFRAVELFRNAQSW